MGRYVAHRLISLKIKKFFAQSRGETRFFIKSDDAALISFKLFATSTVRTFAVTESRNSARTAVGQQRKGKFRLEGVIQARN